MRILFVQTNMNSSLMPLPIGAAMAAWRLRRDGHDVRFLDLMGERNAVAAARRSTLEFRPDLACFSIRNRDNQSLLKYHDPLPGIRAVVESVREATAKEARNSLPLLLGGTAFTTFPQRMLEYFSAEYGMAGDALAPLAAFVRSLENGHADLDTPGLVYRDEAESIRCNPFRVEGYRDVDTGYHELIDRKRYRRTYWDAAVITRSGCPENCVYCDTFRTFGRSFILREPEAIAEEVAMLRRTRKLRSVWLVDAGFNRPLGHAKAVLEALIRREARAVLYSVYDPGEGDEEFFRLYRLAGGGSFMMFAESLSDGILEGLDKSFRYEHILRDARAIRAAGLDFMLMPTLGGPGETRATVEETLERAPALRAANTDFGIGWRIQPGTVLQKHAMDTGLIDRADECWDAHFYISPDTPLEFLRDRLRRFRRRHAFLPLRMLPFAARMTIRTMSV
jgi:radical SAM superfamily enzyme YgiQ (UPF0313 family)